MPSVSKKQAKLAPAMLMNASRDGEEVDVAPSPDPRPHSGGGKKTQTAASVPIENCLIRGLQSISGPPCASRLKVL
jgi:hypothetical protein